MPYYARKLEDPAVKDIKIRGAWNAPVFELFLLWLHTGSYPEQSGFTKKVWTGKNLVYDGELKAMRASSADTMVWTIKAAWLAWRFGSFLGAKQFQNYAMTRLFKAYERQNPKATVDVDICQDSTGPVRMFFEDIAIRNWGDRSVVDDTPEEWARAIGKDDRFRLEFMKGVAMPLEKRREEPMKLEKYLLKED